MASREAVVTELGGGLLRVTQPLPWALDHVHCYLLPAPDGWTIVDTGLGSPGTVERWEAVIGALDDPRVARVIVTHYHPDHLGAAKALSERFEPREVVQGALDAQLSKSTWIDLDEGALLEFLVTHGMPQDVAAASASAEARMPVTPVTPTRCVEEGDVIEIGDARFEVFHLPGHADGHIVLLDAESGRLFGGDVLLQGITPNIGRWEDTAPDPLGRYFATLERLERLAPAVVYPGHREPISDVVGRAGELRDHHEERLVVAREALHDGPLSTYGVVQRLWSTEGFSLHEQRFALVEALAHLEHLETRGSVLQVAQGRWEGT